ncbi:MAG: hypothetical protein AAGG01_07815 [Planctomycetota bacterium]
MTIPMRPYTPALAPFAAASIGVTFLGGLAYAPEEGAQDTQYWSVTHTLELQEIDASLSNDDPINVPEIEMRTTRSRTLALEQKHVAASDGLPDRLRRSFVEVDDSLEGVFNIPSDSVAETLDAAVEIDLEDRTVQFVRTDDGWKKTFVDEDGEETSGPADALEELRPDANLGGLLSELDDPAEGATWTADASALIALIAPAGGLGESVEVSSVGERGMEPVMAGLDPLLGMDLHHLVAGAADGSLSGEIECKVASLSGDEAVIEINVDVTANRDASERVKGWLEGFDGPMSVEVSSAAAELTAAGGGKVTWSVATGLPTSVDLELDLTYRIEREATLTMPDDGEVVLTTIFDLAGTLKSEMSAE